MMERFRFGENAGPNGKITTYNGSVALYHDYPDGDHCSVETWGPHGGERARMIIDKATAGKLGAALLTWAMPDNKSLRAHLGDVLAAYEAVEAVNKAKPVTAWRGAWGFDFIPRFDGDFPGNPGGKKEAMAAAIEARENGEWDHPSLMAVGPLMPDEDADIAEIKRFYED